jgi:hypothetical protein
MNPQPRNYLIWSIEHSAWWKPNQIGYCDKRENAGRYTLSEASAIVREANIGNNDIPNEAMIQI